MTIKERTEGWEPSTACTGSVKWEVAGLETDLLSCERSCTEGYTWAALDLQNSIIPTSGEVQDIHDDYAIVNMALPRRD